MAIRRFRPGLFGRLAKDCRGTSAVEFALCTPFFIFGGIAVYDTAHALADKMSIGTLLRAGAQTAMTDAGPTAVEQAMRASTPANFQFPDKPRDGAHDELTLAADRFCACPDTPDTPAICTATCAGNAVPSVRYRLDASMTYTGIILPTFSLSDRLSVTVR